ncbi:MAG: peptidylprolyl isomerase [Acidimicrobiia bacterium]
MKRRTRLILLVALLAVLAAACAAPDTAARINDTTVSDGDIYALRAADVDVTASGEDFRADLTLVIVNQSMLDQANDQFGITGTDTEEGRRAYMETATQPELDAISREISDPTRTQSYSELVVTYMATRSAVRSVLATDEEILTRVWEEQQQALVEVCANSILVQTQEEAEVAKARIDAGESFAAVADEVSGDPNWPGGALPCPAKPGDFFGVYGQTFVNAMYSAPVGSVTVPFQGDAGWHLMLVDSREFPQTYEEFAADPQRWIPNDVISGAWSVWVNDALSGADITVRSQIGSWYSEADGILPPPESP